MDDKVLFGIMFGMGVMLVMLGGLGWFHTNYCVEKLSYIFGLVGIDASRHYLIADLNKLMRIYVSFLVMGVMTLFVGSLGIRMKLKPHKQTGWLTVLGLFLIQWGVQISQLFFLTWIGVLLIIAVWVWEIHRLRKTTKKEIVL